MGRLDAESAVGHTNFLRPLLGGFYVTDLLVAMVSFMSSALCTCALAELLDTACIGAWYVFFSLPRDIFLRWRCARRAARSGGSQPTVFGLLLLCTIHFVLRYMPFAMPRIAMASETLNPFVQWRTGGMAPVLTRAYHGAGFRAFWLTNTYEARELPNRFVMLYLHGGGFALSSSAMYVEALLRIMALAWQRSAHGASLECVTLEYDLTPHARFPVALLQALRCYAHLVEVKRVDPARIVLAGDSAGGNLVMSMLLVLSGQTRRADVCERNWTMLPMPARAILVSPWLDLRAAEAQMYAPLRDTPSAPTSSESSTLDFIAAESLLQFAQLYSDIIPRPRRVAGPIARVLARPWAAALRDRLRRPALTGAPAFASVEGDSHVVDCPMQLYAPPLFQHSLLMDPLVSPVLGDWTRVQLPYGLFVTWGEEERMATDIATWVTRIALDGAATLRMETHTEPGAFGVHIWPFVSMYVGASVRERERGLEMLADAVLDLALPTYTHDTSPASMPSDCEPDVVEREAAQRAWEAELARMGHEQPLPSPVHVY